MIAKNNQGGNMKHKMHDFLIDLGARPKRDRPGKFILDHIDSEFYLQFDASRDESDPSPNTVDFCLVSMTEDFIVCLKPDCREHDVMRIIAAMGISRFTENTRQAFHDWHRGKICRNR